MANKQLTPMQEAFVQHYIKNGNGHQAYCAAGYKVDNMSRDAIDTEVKRLKKHPLISLRIQEYYDKTQAKTEITVESLCLKLGEVFLNAKACEQNNAAVSALMAQAKLLGLVIDKAKVENTIKKPEDLLLNIVAEAEERKREHNGETTSKRVH